MDQNSFELGLAAIAMIQTVALAYIAVIGKRSNDTVSNVHRALERIDAKTPPATPSAGGDAKG